jgi:hypothetical protein
MLPLDRFEKLFLEVIQGQCRWSGKEILHEWDRLGTSAARGRQARLARAEACAGGAGSAGSLLIGVSWGDMRFIFSVLIGYIRVGYFVASIKNPALFPSFVIAGKSSHGARLRASGCPKFINLTIGLLFKN